MQRFLQGLFLLILPRLTHGYRRGGVCECWQWGEASSQHALPNVLQAPPDLWDCCCLHGCPWSLCLRSQSLSTLPLVSYAKTMLDISLPGLTHPPNFSPQELQRFLLVRTGLGNQGCPVRPCVCLASPLSLVRTCEGGSSQSSRQQEE